MLSVHAIDAASLPQVRAFLLGLNAEERRAGFGIAMSDRLVRAFCDMEVREGMMAVAEFSDGALSGLAAVMMGFGAVHSARIAFFVHGAIDGAGAVERLLDESLRIAAVRADTVTIPIADLDGPLATALRRRGASFGLAGGVRLASLRVGNDAYRWVEKRPLATRVEPTFARDPLPDPARDVAIAEAQRRVLVRSPFAVVEVASGPERAPGPEAPTDVDETAPRQTARPRTDAGRARGIELARAWLSLTGTPVPEDGARLH